MGYQPHARGDDEVTPRPYDIMHVIAALLVIEQGGTVSVTKEDIEKADRCKVRAKVRDGVVYITVTDPHDIQKN